MHFGAMDLHDALNEYKSQNKYESNLDDSKLGKRELLGIWMAVGLLFVIASTSFTVGGDKPNTAKKILMSSSR